MRFKKKPQTDNLFEFRCKGGRKQEMSGTMLLGQRGTKHRAGSRRDNAPSSNSRALQMAATASHSISLAADQRAFTGKWSLPQNTRVSQSFGSSNHNPLPKTPLKLFYSSQRCHLLPAKVTEGYFPYRVSRAPLSKTSTRSALYSL